MNTMIMKFARCIQNVMYGRQVSGDTGHREGEPVNETRRRKYDASGAEHRADELSFREHAERIIRSARRRHLSHRTTDNYQTALNSFMAFRGGADMAPSDITAAVTARYQQWLTGRGLCRNTVSCYMRSLRALYNKLPATCRRSRSDPFRGVFTGNDKTVKRAAGGSDIASLAALPLDAGSRLALWRDVFIFCFYAMGMPFVDASHLRRSDIHGGVIEYRRRKTGQPVCVRIEPCMRRIIDRYANPASPFLFPILGRETGPKNKSANKRTSNSKKDSQAKTKVNADDDYRRYRSALGSYNLALKRLARMAGIGGTLSSYVARHTWASIAYSHQISVNVIAQALGHASPNVTMTYIRDLDRETLFKANRKIIKEIKGIKNAPLRKRCKS